MASPAAPVVLGTSGSAPYYVDFRLKTCTKCNKRVLVDGTTGACLRGCNADIVNYWGGDQLAEHFDDDGVLKADLPVDAYSMYRMILGETMSEMVCDDALDFQLSFDTAEVGQKRKKEHMPVTDSYLYLAEHALQHLVAPGTGLSATMLEDVRSAISGYKKAAKKEDKVAAIADVANRMQRLGCMAAVVGQLLRQTEYITIRD
jgi:hypothetical protein